MSHKMSLFPSYALQDVQYNTQPSLRLSSFISHPAFFIRGLSTTLLDGVDFHM